MDRGWMSEAYRAAGRLFRDRLAVERPELAGEMDRVRPDEVVVVAGAHDHMHRVLDATGVPYRQVTPHELEHAVDWDRLQVLFVNCPGEMPASALERVGAWVRAGGYLVTTDWALRHVIEPLFPGTAQHNGVRTPDCVIRVHEVEGEQDPLLAGFLEDGREPLWWLESSSFPIEVLDAERVRVLVRSGEAGARFGADPVVVTFTEGEGTVLHLMSHLYLQRTECRGARDRVGAAVYLGAELGCSPMQVAEYENLTCGAPLTAAEMSSSLRKAKLASGVILTSREQARRRRERAAEGESEARQPQGTQPQGRRS